MDNKTETNDASGPDDAQPQQEELLRMASTVDEKKLVRKLDLHIIPLVMALYLFSFLDRYVCTGHTLNVLTCPPTPPSSPFR